MDEKRRFSIKMTNEDWLEVQKHVQEWIKEAGDLIIQSIGDELTIEYKTSTSDLVTNMDEQIERFFIRKIKEAYPHHRILGEEGFGDDITSLDGVIWLIDPIDGTTNFVHQRKHFAVSVAVYEDGTGKIGFIYDVTAGELYHCLRGEGAYLNGRKLPKLKRKQLSNSMMGLNATWITANRRIDPTVLGPLVTATRSTRSYGSAAIEMAYVAAGRLDIYISMRLSPWDFAAGLILIEEVGGVITQLDGEPLDLLKQNSVLVANPFIYEEILNVYILPKIK